MRFWDKLSSVFSALQNLRYGSQKGGEAPASKENELSAAKALISLLNASERRHLIVLGLLLFLAGLLEMLGLGVIFIYVGYFAKLTAGEAFAPGLQWLEEILQALPAGLVALAGGAAFIALFIIKAFAILGIRFQLIRFVFSVFERFSVKIFDSYLQISLPYYATRSSAEIQRDINVQPNAIFNIAAVSLTYIVSNIISIAFLTLILLLIEPMATLLAVLVVLGVSGTFYAFLRRHLAALGRRRHVVAASVIKWVTQAMGALKEIRIAREEKAFQTRYETQIHQLARANRYLRVASLTPSLVNEITIITGIVGVLLYYYFAGKNIAELMPILATFGVAGVRIAGMIGSIVTHIQTLQFQGPAIHSMARLVEELERDAAQAEKVPPKPPAMEFRREIELAKVSFEYPGAHLPALKDISIRIPRGSHVGFVGPTGSGKSTLVLILAGLLNPTEGSVLIDGEPISQIRGEWFDKISYVPQKIFILDDSIRANVAFSTGNLIDDEAVWRALELAQIADFVRNLPHGLDTLVGEDGAQLSGGERQRLGIARALYREPEVILFDEATSALDNKTERQLIGNLLNSLKNVTIIMVAHRLSTVVSCERIFCFDHGSLVGEGTYKELAKSSIPFSELASIHD